MGYSDPTRQADYQRDWIAKRRATWLADKTCAVCGSTDRLEVDHINPNEKVSNRIWCWSIARRDAELAKCQVLCHQHHAEKTARDRRAVIEHPSDGAYHTLRCRCQGCREAHMQHNRRWRASRGRGVAVPAGLISQRS